MATQWQQGIPKMRGPWLITVAFTVASLVMFVSMSTQNAPSSPLAAAYQLQTYLNLNNISCVSIDPYKIVFDRKSYWDADLIDEIKSKLLLKSVLINEDYKACQAGFFATVVPGEESAVRYNGLPAQYLISIGICERNSDGSMKPSACLTKNIYVFDPRLDPRRLFSIAIIGLAAPQHDQFQMIDPSRLL